VSQKTSYLWLAIILTYTIRLRYFLAEVVLLSKQEIRRCFLFLPHLSICSALPCETGNPEIASFHLNTVFCFANKCTEYIQIITWSLLNYPSFPKWSTVCIKTLKTYLEREHSILLSVSGTLYVYQVCNGASRCVKDGRCSSSGLEWKLTDSINGISYYLNKCQMLSHTSHMTFFFFQEDGALAHMHCACNTVQLLRLSRLPFS